MRSNLRVLDARPDLSNARLVFRPNPQFHPSNNANIPVILGPGGPRPVLPDDLLFDGRSISRALAAELAGENTLIGWGPVPDGDGKRGSVRFKQGQIWLTEQTSDGYRTLVLSDDRVTRRRGKRNGYRILARVRTRMLATRRDNGSFRLSVTQKLAMDGALLETEEAGRRQQPAGLRLDRFVELGMVEQWVRYHYRGGGGGLSGPPTIFRGGFRSFDAKGKLLTRYREDIPLPVIPYTSQGAGGAFGRSVEAWFLSQNWKLDLFTWYFGAVSAGLGLAGAFAALFGPVGVAIGSALVIASRIGVVLAVIFGTLSWLNTNYVAPGAGEVAEALYNWAHGIKHIPGTDSQGNIIEEDSFFDISNGDPWAEGYGQSELWEFMEDNLPDNLSDPGSSVPSTPAPEDDEEEEDDEEDEEEDVEDEPPVDDGSGGETGGGNDEEEPGPEPPVAVMSGTISVLVPAS